MGTSNTVRSTLLLVVRVLAIAGIALNPALTLMGVWPEDPHLPLWFTCAWAAAAIVALALAQAKGERLVIRYVPPALQVLIVAAIATAALPDIPRRLPFAILVGALYWDGLARVWSRLAKSAGRRA